MKIIFSSLFLFVCATSVMAQRKGIVKIGPSVIVNDHIHSRAVGGGFSLEQAVGSHWSVGASIDYGADSVMHTETRNIGGTNAFIAYAYKNKTWAIRPELRYYFIKNNNGFYLGPAMGIYNYIVPNVETPGGQLFITQQKTTAVMFGLTTGLSLHVTPSINADISANIGKGLGTASSSMDGITGALSLRVGYRF